MSRRNMFVKKKMKIAKFLFESITAIHQHFRGEESEKKHFLM